MAQVLLAGVLLLPALTGVGLAIYHMEKENVSKQAVRSVRKKEEVRKVVKRLRFLSFY